MSAKVAEATQRPCKRNRNALEKCLFQTLPPLKAAEGGGQVLGALGPVPGGTDDGGQAKAHVPNPVGMVARGACAEGQGQGPARQGALPRAMTPAVAATQCLMAGVGVSVGVGVEAGIGVALAVVYSIQPVVWLARRARNSNGQQRASPINPNGYENRPGDRFTVCILQRVGPPGLTSMLRHCGRFQTIAGRWPASFVGRTRNPRKEATSGTKHEASTSAIRISPLTPAQRVGSRAFWNVYKKSERHRYIQAQRARWMVPQDRHRLTFNERCLGSD